MKQWEKGLGLQQLINQMSNKAYAWYLGHREKKSMRYSEKALRVNAPKRPECM